MRQVAPLGQDGQLWEFSGCTIYQVGTLSLPTVPAPSRTLAVPRYRVPKAGTLVTSTTRPPRVTLQHSKRIRFTLAHRALFPLVCPTSVRILRGRPSTSTGAV